MNAMIPKIEIIKEGLSNVRGGAFSFATAVESQSEDCLKDCLVVNDDTVGTLKGRVKNDDTLQPIQTRP